MNPEPSGTHDDLETEDPGSVLEAEAVRLHEVYLALKKAGFSKGQCESFVAELVTESFGHEAIA